MKKNFNIVVTIIALLVASTQARANDSAMEGVGGTPSALTSLKKVAPLKGEHPNIRMVRERVAMTVGSEYYDVVADFVFHNDSAARAVLMGFPESAGGDIDFSPLEKKSAYKNFATWVDGAKVSCRRIPLIEKEYGGLFQAYWVKSVRFGKHQTRRVRVSYRAPLGESTDGVFVNYDFTGGNWKDKVEESLMMVKFAAPGVYQIRPFGDSSQQKWRRASTRFYRWRNWQAQDGFSLYFQTTLPDALMRADEEKDLKQTWALWEGASTLVVPHDSAQGDRWQVATTQYTDLVLREGRVFISMRALAAAIRVEIARREIQTQTKQRYGAFDWNSKTQTAVLTIPAWGQSPQRVLRVRAGSKDFSVNKSTYGFPASTFIGGAGDHRGLYAPLDALVAAVGGKAKVNLKTRRVWFELPV